MVALEYVRLKEEDSVVVKWMWVAVRASSLRSLSGVHHLGFPTRLKILLFHSRVLIVWLYEMGENGPVHEVGEKGIECNSGRSRICGRKTN